MKNKLGQSIPSKILKSTSSTSELIENIKNLTVEDVIVMYAYAEAIVETVREPLIILDGNLRIKTANKSFFDTFNVTKKETYNKYIFDLGNGQWNIPKLKKLLREILPKSSQFNDFEVNHNFEDIGEKTMLLNARRIVLEGYKTELILLSIEDVTQRKIVDKHKDDFIGIVSHELRTPLTIIKSFTQLLQTYNQKIQSKKNIFMLEKVATQVDRMVAMIASFLNVYALQIGKFELHKKRFLLDDLIKEISEAIQYSIKTHKVVYKGNIMNKFYADKERIGQVVTNLITNAIKYSPKSDKVIVTTQEHEDSITVCVQDFGIGIPKEYQKYIFDKFFRVRRKNEKEVKGLGLGLHIAYGIVREHKGNMWVQSEKGKGSTFYFTLPKLNK